MKISDITISPIEFPLVKPYKLSFTTLFSFKGFRVGVTIENGEYRTADLIPLHGYSDESYDRVEDFLLSARNKFTERTLNEARDQLAAQIPDRPFSVSPLLTAIDLFEIALPEITTEHFSFVSPISIEDFTKENCQDYSLPSTGTLKVKLSGNHEIDIEGIEVLMNVSKLHFLPLRFDANQGYNIDSAFKVFEVLEKYSVSHNIEYVEQPLDVNDWEGNRLLLEKFPRIEIMLDEPIITERHLTFAKELGIGFVKFKLYKQGGIQELNNLIEKAYQLGLKVVLGNGVATWPTNELELKVHRAKNDIIHGASEANGFFKVKDE